MHNLWFKVMREEKKDGSSEGGGNAPVSTKEPTPAADGAPPKESGDNIDDLGYEKLPEDKKPVEDKKPADDKKVEPTKEEKSVAGYDDETKDEPLPPEPKETAPPAEADEYDKVEAFKGLPEKEAASIKEFAKKHKISVEVAKEFGDLRRKELSDALEYQKSLEKEAKEAIQRQRSTWTKELKDDGKFGGERFPETIKKTNKILDEFFPRWKKTLTERKGMLPPDIMRDLAELADHLFSKEKVANGQPPTPAGSKEDDPDEHLKFYS